MKFVVGMPCCLLPGLLALMCAMIAPSASAAEPFTAGERRLATTSPTAAARNHGDAVLRLTVLYPNGCCRRGYGTGSSGWHWSL